MRGKKSTKLQRLRSDDIFPVFLDLPTIKIGKDGTGSGNWSFKQKKKQNGVKIKFEYSILEA